MRPSRRYGRASGVVAPRAIPRAPVLPAVSRFDAGAVAGAFWLVRAADRGTGELFVSSGARVLRDLRAELGVTTGDLAWTVGLLERLRDRARALGLNLEPLVGALPAAGAEVTGDWLALALWTVYSAEAWPRMPGVVALPERVTLPRVGRVLEGGDQPTEAATGFDPALLTSDPWAAIAVTGAPRRRKKRGGGAALAMLALAAVTIGGR